MICHPQARRCLCDAALLCEEVGEVPAEGEVGGEREGSADGARQRGGWAATPHHDAHAVVSQATEGLVQSTLEPDGWADDGDWEIRGCTCRHLRGVCHHGTCCGTHIVLASIMLASAASILARASSVTRLRFFCAKSTQKT